jgi:hypothetical protein
VDNFFAFDDLDRRRRDLGISVAELCEDAVISVRTWRRARTDPYHCQRSLYLAKLALDDRESDVMGRNGPEGILRVVIVLATYEFGRLNTGLEVINTDFRVQRPRDKQWLEASRIRRIAMVVLIETGMERRDVVEACQCSRQNVAQAVGQVYEEMDEDPAFAAKLERLIASAS